MATKSVTESLPTAPAAPVAAGPLAPYAKGSMAKLVTFAEPKVIDNIAFMDRNKKAVNLSDFKGQVVVLNVWATWCAPCRFEMPTLAHLQKLYAGKGVKVLPLSVDTEDKFADVVSFIDVQEPLEVYADQNFQAPSKFGVTGMPATLILDKKGREVARLDGEATWDTPEVQALLDKLLAE
jgi:thiol-disulfide isomerase/thioredoxin